MKQEKEFRRVGVSEWTIDLYRQFFGFPSAVQAMVLGCVLAYASFVAPTSNL
jgi:hypothetical protein